MIAAIGEVHRDVHHGKAQRALLVVFLHPGLDGGNVGLGHDAAGDGVGELEAGTARQRADLQHHVAELAVAAGLLLVAAAGGRGLADGLLEGDVARRGLRADAELVAQLLQSHAQMHLALPPEHHFPGIGLMAQLKGGIFLGQLGYGGGELHLVLLVGHGDGHAIDGRGGIGHEDFRHVVLVHGDALAGGDLLQAAKGHGVARAGPGGLLRLLAEHGEHAADARGCARAVVERVAILDFAGQNARQGEFALGGIEGLHDIGRAPVVRVNAEPLDGLFDAGDVMAQGLEQAQNAVFVLRRAEQNRRDVAFHQFGAQILENLVRRRLHVRQEGFHEIVVIVGQLLHHLEAGFLLALLDLFGDVHDFRLGPLAVDVGALQGQIDGAYGDAVLPDGHLAQHQRMRRGGLEIFQNLAHMALGLVDLVDEDDARQADLVQLLENDLQGGGLLRIGLHDDDGGVAAHQGGAGVLGELHRAGAVDEGVGVAQKIRGGGVELDAHAVGAGRLGGVADGRSVLDAALARNRAGAVKNGFQKGRLAALIGAHERDAPRAGRSAAVFVRHGCFLLFPVVFAKLLTAPRAFSGRRAISARPRRRRC